MPRHWQTGDVITRVAGRHQSRGRRGLLQPEPGPGDRRDAPRGSAANAAARAGRHLRREHRQIRRGRQVGGGDASGG